MLHLGEIVVAPSGGITTGRPVSAPSTVPTDQAMPRRFIRGDAGLTGSHGAYEVCERGIR